MRVKRILQLALEGRLDLKQLRMLSVNNWRNGVK